MQSKHYKSEHWKLENCTSIGENYKWKYHIGDTRYCSRTLFGGINGRVVFHLPQQRHRERLLAYKQAHDKWKILSYVFFQTMEHVFLWFYHMYISVSRSQGKSMVESFFTFPARDTGNAPSLQTSTPNRESPTPQKKTFKSILNSVLSKSKVINLSKHRTCLIETLPTDKHTKQSVPFTQKRPFK